MIAAEKKRNVSDVDEQDLKYLQKYLLVFFLSLDSMERQFCLHRIVQY